jgi:hypothetical protein
MKKITLPLISILLISNVLTSSAQTIRRVNNTGITGTNIYATLQAAHNAASAGDIVYIEGSGTSYAGAQITKRLTIIGPGYLLAENYPNFGDLRPAEFSFSTNLITFDTGSEGSILTGCSGFQNALNVNVKVSSITISRNRSIDVHFDNVNTPISGITITKNYGLYVSFFNSSASIGVLISNNHLSAYLGSMISGTFSNNIIDGTTNLLNFNLSNNILITGSFTYTNCTFSNNIDARALTNSSAFGTTNGNLANVDKTTLFIGATGNSTDGQWKLKTGSVAIGAGTGGTDCGIYGGGNPYELSGISSADYPAIIKLTTSDSGSSTTPLSVTISTKSN